MLQHNGMARTKKKIKNLHPFLAFALEECRWPAAQHGIFTFRRLGGAQRWAENLGKDKFFAPYGETNHNFSVVQSVVWSQYRMTHHGS